MANVIARYFDYYFYNIPLFHCYTILIAQTEWSGSICECSTINATCSNSNQLDELCSGHGDCRCGRCRCNEGYYGEFCQDCAVN